eukprot:CAMPEP_0172158606 /NCGR_PEP_ID=MMETSP1050-20130122/4469_1 /TAXON_ID=233186 /ORGANISM="Cryptomonas curvata, Strain CCAP979/52" /LENGTH=212 /DNA_ID=CAMNT_0012828023 /DNA_START=170 /DNA_END=805 /DNA_ORIENTATION=-
MAYLCRIGLMSESNNDSTVILSSPYSERELDFKLQREEKAEEDGMRQGLRNEANFDYAVINRQTKKKQEIARKAAESDLSQYGKLLSFEEPLDRQQERPLTYSHGHPQVSRIVTPVHQAPTAHPTIKRTTSISDLEKRFDAWEREHHKPSAPDAARAHARWVQAPLASPPTPGTPKFPAAGGGADPQGRSYAATLLTQRHQPRAAPRPADYP